MKFDIKNEVISTINLFKGGRPHEDDFNSFLRHQFNTFIDVGANSGQSAASYLMNCPDAQVISFEPNLLYEPVLSKLSDFFEKKFCFHMYGLSDCEGSFDLHVPLVDGIPYMQESSLSLEQFKKPWVLERLCSYGGTINYESISCVFVTADSVINDADVIKIDAEGAELKVLLGFANLIYLKHPIFLIENNDFINVTAYLGTFGYSAYQWRGTKLIPLETPCTNCFYLTQNHLLELKLV